MVARDPQWKREREIDLLQEIATIYFSQAKKVRTVGGDGFFSLETEGKEKAHFRLVVDGAKCQTSFGSKIFDLPKR